MEETHVTILFKNNLYIKLRGPSQSDIEGMLKHFNASSLDDLMLKVIIIFYYS